MWPDYYSHFEEVQIFIQHMNISQEGNTDTEN
jgi:hypothetical protein